MKAFSDDRYDYYELTQPLGFYKGNHCKNGYLIPKGAIFVHDTDDHVRGSIGDGCLKLCWTPDGNCYGSLCSSTVIFHAEFKNTDLFRLVDSKASKKEIARLESIIDDLEAQLSKAKDSLRKIKGR